MTEQHDQPAEGIRHQASIDRCATRVSRLRDLQSLSDFAITCAESEWAVHKAVLIMHSSVLEKACNGEFEERHEAHLDLSEESPSTVAALIHYMYHFNYEFKPDAEAGNEKEAGPLTFHVKMFQLGDYLDIDVLKDLAAEKFTNALKSTSDMTEIVRAAIMVYKVRTIARPICVPTVAFLVTDRKARDGTNQSAEVEQAMRDVPELAIDVVRAQNIMLDAPKGPKDGHHEYRCPNCKRTFRTIFPSGTASHYCLAGCGGRLSGTSWNASHKAAPSKTAEVVKVESGAWWRD